MLNCGWPRAGGPGYRTNSVSHHTTCHNPRKPLCAATAARAHPPALHPRPARLTEAGPWSGPTLSLRSSPGSGPTSSRSPRPRPSGRILRSGPPRQEHRPFFNPGPALSGAACKRVSNARLSSYRALFSFQVPSAPESFRKGTLRQHVWT